MNLKTSKLRNAICFAIAASATAVAGTGVAFAQEGQQTTELDRIQVTGSRIRQVDLATPAPVVQVSREDIDRMGFQTVGDILQNLPVLGSPPISRANALSAGEGNGGTFVSLRNLGAERSLVLLNGKRLGITTSGLADISLIPAAAIERIEVLKDGASAIYGSDAIAGVVNLITRTGFDGVQGSVYFGQYDEGDGDTLRGDMVLGVTGERSSLTIAAEWGEEDGVWAKDRPYSAYPRSYLHPTDSWTTVGEYGGFVASYSNRALFPGITFPAPTATNPNPGVRVVWDGVGDPTLPTSYIAQDQSVGSCNASGCTPGSTLHKSNSNEQMYLRTPREYKSLFLDGTYDLSDNVRFRTNLAYNNRTTERSIAGYPFQGPTFGVVVDADSYFNPTGADISNWWRRLWEVPRGSTTTTDNYRFTGAFEGSFEVGERYFDWDVSYMFNENRLTRSDRGDIALSPLRAAVGPSFLNADGVVQCGTAADPIALSACLPWNPFLHSGVTGPNALTGNDVLIDRLFPIYHDTGKTSTTVWSANVTGSLFTLPAGELAFAAGVETRKEKGEFEADALKIMAETSGLASKPTRGSYNVDEVYLELSVPLLRDIVGANELTLDVATRYSDYDLFGDTTNSKVGLKWRPIESLLVRATWAEGFRTPTILDLYGGGSQTFATFADPCDTVYGAAASNPTVLAACTADMGAIAATFRQLQQGFVPSVGPSVQTPVPFFSSAGNPTLTAEESESKTVGLVYSPDFLPGFNVALDWWNIRVENTIVGDTPTLMLNDCYVQGISSRCSDLLFTRDPVQGYVTNLRFGFRNAGYREVEGFDFDWNYRFETGSFGDFVLTSNTTYTVSDVLLSTNDPRVPLSSVSFGGNHRIRSNTGLNWSMGDWGASWNARFYSRTKENCTYFVPGSTEPNLECDEITYAPTGAYLADGVTPASQISRRRLIGSNTFHDLQIRYNAPWNAVIAVGANNVFNHEGPVTYVATNGDFTYNGAFDIGRFVYMKYTQKF
ncbi:TonB-dependent receptor plug domain-containing protein [Luteimonas sp. SDU101]|uniref:TonB-dependent receptor plug domain-containing protein n=1 Tax=unclassified Luteimonas TaxID=2629088 RepID=UPI003EBAD15C